MTMNTKVQYKIAAGFAAILFTVAVSALGTYASLRVVGDVIEGLLPDHERRTMVFKITQELDALSAHFERYLAVSGGEYHNQINDDLEILAQDFAYYRDIARGTTEVSRIKETEDDLDALVREVRLFLSFDRTRDDASRLNDQILVVYKHLQKVKRDIATVASVQNESFATTVKRAGELINGVLVLFMLSFVAAVTLALGASILSARAVTRPIEALTKAAEELAAGNYATRASVTTHDEIGKLARVFNAMAERLSRYTQDLESQVTERTRELDEKVRALNELNQSLDRNATLLIERDVELSRANERLRELDRTKSEFLSIAAHQLRTPLSAVKWVFGVLLEGHMGALTPEQKSYLLKGEESNRRMVQLVDDLLTVTRIESGKMDFRFFTLGMEDIIQNLIAEFTPRAAEQHIALHYTAALEKSAQVRVDPEKVRYVFDNLIENALRYTNTGGSIDITLKAGGDGYDVAVADNGIGIPEAAQKNIFSKFFRSENAVKKVTDGNGLGLYVAKAIIERHGGRIGFTSELGKGTTFMVHLPAAGTGTSVTATGIGGDA